MTTPLSAFKLARFEFPRDRRIGDSQVVAPNTNWLGTLEVFDTEGRSGLGFFADLFNPLPSAAFIAEYFERNLWRALTGQIPEGLLNRVTRPRGGNIRYSLFDLDEALDVALWDLVAKRAGLPLFRLLGGAQSRQPAYCSGLCFHLSDQEAQDFYSRARRDGYGAYKIKVGHPDLEWDLRRLRLVSTVIGAEARLMVDANEAWSTHQAIQRLRAYADAGFNVYWVEDPVLRHDFAALRELRGRINPVKVNAGEYLAADDRIALVSSHSVDVLNLNGSPSDCLQVGRACAALGVPVSLGNSMMNIGVHLGGALPEVDMAEDSRLDWNKVLRRPIPIVDGHFVLSEEPGHGLSISADAVRE
jgi:L-alanine-DL-glutamate epimerase-like enolase superfamily enzyme